MYSLIYKDAKDSYCFEKLVDRFTEIGIADVRGIWDTSAKVSGQKIIFKNALIEEEDKEKIPKALHYTVKNENGDVVVRTGGRHSYIKIIENFADMFASKLGEMFEKKDFYLEGNFLDDPCENEKPSESDLRVLSTNVMGNLPGYEEDMANVNPKFEFSRRLEIYLAALEYYKPDIVGAQEFCPEWYQGFDGYAKRDEWEILKNYNPNIPDNYVMSTVIYRKDRFEKLDGGLTYYEKFNNRRCRCISWVLLKDKKNGKELCFASTHWDGGYDENRQERPNTLVQEAAIEKFVNEKAKRCAVVTTGDFNRNEYTDSFKMYMENTDSGDSMYYANKRLNKEGSFHGWGVNKSSAGSCDHITVTKKHLEALQFETLMYNEQIYSSDHAWIMADIKYKN